jgi:catechol 2,3-dioxygenase-like lactoylglutathione lyase family enzyme
MKYNFHHLHIICKDLEQMITFFTDALNAKLVIRRKFGTADGASLDLQGITINLPTKIYLKEVIHFSCRLQTFPIRGLLSLKGPKILPSN